MFDNINELKETIELAISIGTISTSFLQRKLKIGYNKASRLIDFMEDNGIVSGYYGSNPREILVSIDRWQEISNDFFEKLKDYSFENNDENELITSQISNFEIKEINEDDSLIETIDFSNFENIVISECKNNIIPFFIDTVVKKISFNSLKIIVYNFDMLKYENYNGLSNFIIPIITDTNKWNATINWLIQEIQNRYNVLNQNKVKTYIEYNNINKDKLCDLFVVVDEINELYYKDNSMLDESLSKILNYGKAVGIHLIMATSYNYNVFKLPKSNSFINIVDDNTFIRKINSLINNNYHNENNIEKENLLAKIDSELTGIEFENISKLILEKNGFEQITITKCSNDYGADIIAIKNDIRYAIQCKKYSQQVGVSSIQEVIASKSIYNCHVAVVLTNNYFTTNAIQLASANNVLLWDRKKLTELINNI